MSERDQSVEPFHADRKFFSKHKWRGKFFASEERITKTRDHLEGPVNEVDEFLQRPTRDESDSLQTAGAEPRTGGSSDSGLPLISFDKEANSGAGYQKRKVPRRQGLRVAFDSAPPAIIGEGGDEAELPSIDVAGSRARAKSRRQPHDSVSRLHSRKSSPPPHTELVIGQERSSVLLNDDNLGPPAPLQRRSTGLPDAQQANACNEASDAQNETVTTHIQRQQSVPTPVSTPGCEGDSEDFAAIYAKYTRASPVSPHVDLDKAPTKFKEDPLIQKNDIEDLRGRSSLKAFSSELDPSFENSLTPAPSPRPLSVQEKLPLDYDFPATASSKDSNRLSKETSQRYHKETQPERPMLSPSTLNPTVTSPPILNPPLTGLPHKAPQKSLRTVARNLAGDALHEFGTRVQRFYGMFRLGASANRTFIDVSFEDWIRAGAWWFLKGRGELEKAVRNRPGSRDRSLNHDARDVPSELKQAHLNLAKASWIISDVTINHSDVRKYGSGSMASLLAITKSLGDSNLAELIEMHLAITASLRALTMSMRRNDKMPPSDFEAQGLESRIWLETPRLASGVASILRGNYSTSLLQDGSINSDMILSYPIGDTDSHFNYGSMFVDAVLKSSEDPQQGVHISCIVAVLRQKTERDLEVVLASQDGKVNLKISSKNRGGHTWRNVHWRTDARCMVLRLSDTHELIIQFQENGFRTLWGIYDYTRKIRKDLEATEVEAIVFRSIVKCVHYVDPPDAKVFPADPVQRCDLRLFESSPSLAESSGRRKFYDGHRLIVVTPPSSKVLSKISQLWGKKTPMLFSYVRGEEDQAAILLKNNTVGSTLVITFNTSAEREQFHSQLDGTFMREEESCCDIIHLQSMHIYGSTSNEPWAEENCITKYWRWDQMRIFNRRPEYFENGVVKTVLSKNLRIWMECEAGAFVDRINLGQSARE